MRERPKYPTGLRVWLLCMALAAVGFLVAAYGAPLPGLLVALAALVIAPRLRRGRQRMWPDDYPVLARLVGREPYPERWAPTPRWEETASAHSRLRRGIGVVALGALMLVFVGTGVWGNNWNPAWSPQVAAVLGALVVIRGVLYVRQALHDLRAH